MISRAAFSTLCPEAEVILNNGERATVKTAPMGLDLAWVTVAIVRDSLTFARDVEACDVREIVSLAR